MRAAKMEMMISGIGEDDLAGRLWGMGLQD
jgi:hypothetical protein